MYDFVNQSQSKTERQFEEYLEEFLTDNAPVKLVKRRDSVTS